MGQDDVLAIFAAEFPEGHQAALAASIVASCGASVASVKSRYEPPFPTGHVLGQNRFFDIQYGLLHLGLGGAVCRTERHPHGTTSYTSIETERVRITTRKVDKKMEPCPPTLFRLREQALQLSFDFDKLVCEVQIVIAKDGGDMPRSIEVCFPDGQGGFRDESVDILALLNKPIPVESVPDGPETTARPAQDIRSTRKTTGA